jgi:hypothetical protein
MSKCLRLGVVLCLLLSGCSRAVPPTALPGAPPTSASAAVVSPTATPRPTGPFAVASASYAEGSIRANAWVTDAAPPLGSRIAIRGSLTGPGVQHCVMMRATWSQKGAMASDGSQVTYGSGKAAVEIVGFALGQFVPVTVTLSTDGVEYTVHTGFTPR